LANLIESFAFSSDKHFLSATKEKVEVSHNTILFTDLQIWLILSSVILHTSGCRSTIKHSLGQLLRPAAAF